MIKEEVLTETLIRHYSDQSMKILQVETGILYDEAVDVAPCEFTYEESTEPIDENSADAGGVDTFIFSIYNCEGSVQWNTSKVPQTLSEGGYLEATFINDEPLTNHDHIIAIGGDDRTGISNWSFTNGIGIYQPHDNNEQLLIRQNSVSTKLNIDITIPHKVRIDSDYVYIDGEPIVATNPNLLARTSVVIGGIEGSKRFGGRFYSIEYK